MIDYESFISNSHSMLIAPAGYGKTYTITACLKHTSDKGKQLILTHTHAGVASIKEKIKKNDIHNSQYHVETITSFAQKYVFAFYTGNDIPEQQNSSDYYTFIIQKSTELFKLKPIQNIIKSTYSGLFVDEYQDCTLMHHALILSLSKLFPTRILGDYLQGIFGFNGETLVDIQDTSIMGEFLKEKFELDKPQRWMNGNNENLGSNLKEIRQQLINSKEIDLLQHTAIEHHLINESDLYNRTKDYYKKVNNLLAEENLLIIHHDSTSINPRLSLIKNFNNRMSLIESIDDKEFYKISKYADLFVKEKAVLFIREFCLTLFNKTGVDNWFNETKLKNKTQASDKEYLKLIIKEIKELEVSGSLLSIVTILKLVSKLPKIKCYRKELFHSFIYSLEEAASKNILIYQAMADRRNFIRRVGRKVFGRCIGTTLLTKGLEFDTVVIINAHKFDCPKHFYVAITRASKRLILFTENSKLNPYNLQ